MDDLCTTIAAQIIAGIILYYILPERPTTVSEDGLPPITKKHSKNPKRFTKPKGLKRKNKRFHYHYNRQSKGQKTFRAGKLRTLSKKR